MKTVFAWALVVGATRFPWWQNTVLTAVIGFVVATLLTWLWRRLWKRVLLPVGDAARALSNVADVVAKAQLIPEMNDYLHRRAHDILNALTAMRLGTDSIPQSARTLAEISAELQQVLDEMKALHTSQKGTDQ